MEGSLSSLSQKWDKSTSLEIVRRGPSRGIDVAAWGRMKTRLYYVSSVRRRWKDFGEESKRGCR